MNEPLGQLTSNLHRALSDRGHDYQTRYEAMYAHARELERQMDGLRVEIGRMERLYLNDIPARELKTFLAKYSTHFRHE